MNTYICIDLKSFYASVECVERDLDPFQVNLVVADPTRSKSTICLAITPAMKKLGVRNRCRVHEIPAEIDYITAMPRMQLYIDYSARIYSIYLRYIAPEDIHVYSIDECFMDVTQYLKLYRITAREMAERLMSAVLQETGITATAGVGTNLYLAKIAMDIVAKHAEDHIGFLDETSFRKRLWGHAPLTDFWGIGEKTAARLARYGITTQGDIARMSLTSEDWFFKQFGIDAELMIDHAWGREPCGMKEIKSYHVESHSLSNSQILMRNYSFEEARVVIREMADLLVLKLVRESLVTESVTIMVAYDHRLGQPASGGTFRLPKAGNSSRMILDGVETVYEETTDRELGIRRLSISANRVREEEYYQFDLFSDPQAQIRERNLQEAILKIHRRYGKNGIMRGANLLACSNYRERNQQIGGHRA